MLRSDFHAVRLSGAGQLAKAEGRSLVVFCNHPSWWDPLVCLRLHQCLLTRREAYAPIEARALERYGFFKWLGFFGTEPGIKGARRFQGAAQAVLARRGEAALWLTPEGAMRDVRTRPVTFAPGLAHLARRHPEAVFVPLALEYSFGYEKRPEVLARFGVPMLGADLGGQPVAEINLRLVAGLTEAMEANAAAVQHRAWQEYTALQVGSAGTDGFYDLWKRFRAVLSGQRYRPEHRSVVRNTEG